MSQVSLVRYLDPSAEEAASFPLLCGLCKKPYRDTDDVIARDCGCSARWCDERDREARAAKRADRVRDPRDAHHGCEAGTCAACGHFDDEEGSE